MMWVDREEAPERPTIDHVGNGVFGYTPRLQTFSQAKIGRFMGQIENYEEIENENIER